MKNLHVLPQNAVLKMYHRNAITDDIIQRIRLMWDEHVQFELGLISNEPTLADMHSLAEERSQDTVLLDFKFKSFINGVEWVYLVVTDKTLWSKGDIGFMTVGVKEVSCLFINEGWRKRHIGTFLIHNHLEVFNGALKVKCMTINHAAMAAYHNAGFIFIEGDDLYSTLQFSFHYDYVVEVAKRRTLS